MVDRLGWTLVHFVWEGAAVAAVLALALALTRRAAVRYGLALAALALMAALPVVTFVRLAPAADPVSAGPLRFTSGEAVLGAAAPVEARMPVLVLVWAFGVVLLSLRLAGTVLHLERWRRGSRPASSGEQARLDALARLLGLRRRITLLLSDRIEVPSAWGVLRPVVVLPASLMAGLPPAQVEGILLHELAHVRRHDYLVNLLQGVVETALFYHPAVWWASSVVRRERERLCDDVAVAALGDPMPYARALLQLEERRQAPRPALSAREGDLMNRIARLLVARPAPARLSPLAPSLAALAVAALALGGALRAEAQATKGTRSVDRSPSSQSWHRPGLDVSVRTLGDAYRVVAQAKDGAVVGYYRLGDGDRAWHRPGLDVTIHPTSPGGGELKIEARTPRSNVVAYYQAAKNRGAGLQKSSARRSTDALAELARAENELRVAQARLDVRRQEAQLQMERAELEKAEAMRARDAVSRAGRLSGTVQARSQTLEIRAILDRSRVQIAEAQAQADAARKRLDSARRQGATYGAPGRLQQPLWKSSEYPQGVGRIVASAEAFSPDEAAMRRAQIELSQGTTRLSTSNVVRSVAPATVTLSRISVPTSAPAARIESNRVLDARGRVVTTIAPLHIDVNVTPPSVNGPDVANVRVDLKDLNAVQRTSNAPAIAEEYRAYAAAQGIKGLWQRNEGKSIVTQRVPGALPIGEDYRTYAKAQAAKESWLQAKGMMKVPVLGDLPIVGRLYPTKPFDVAPLKTQGKGFEGFGKAQAPYRLNLTQTWTGASLFGEPKVEFERGKVSIDAKDAAFATLVRSLARKARLSVVIAKGLYADVSLVVSDRSASDALAILCKAAGANLRNENGVYYVSPRNSTTSRFFRGGSFGTDVFDSPGR